MKALEFTMGNIIRDIRGSLFLNIILLCLFSVGMLVPFGCVSMVWNAMDDYWLTAYRESDRIMVAEYVDEARVEREQEMKAVMQGMTETLPEESGIQLSCGALISWQGEVNGSRVAGCSRDFWNLTGYRIVEGKGVDSLYETDENLCLIKENSQFYASGAKPGDVIMIENEPFTIAGIISAYKIYAPVIMSYEKIAQIEKGVELQQQIILKLPQKEKTTKMSGQIRRWMKGQGISDIIQVCSGTKADEIYLASVKRIAAESILTSVALMMFTIISFCAVVSGMLQQEKHRLGVRAISGAEWRQIKREIILRMEMLLLLACLLDFLLYPPVFSGMKSMGRYLAMRSCLPVFLGFAGLTGLINVMLLHRIKRRTGIAGMLKESL